MKKIFEKLEEKARRIANIMIADVVTDVDLLTVALCAGYFDEIAYTIHMSSEGEVKHTAAHRALDLGWKPDLREQMIRDGYFAEGLRGLMDVAKKNPDAGSRLMPVFHEMLSDYRKYGLPEHLAHELASLMEAIRERDGFAITSMNDNGKVVVTPAIGISGD